MAIRVGVTGHRQHRLAKTQLERIDDQIDTILAMIETGMAEASLTYADEYARKEPYLFFVSALADGADTLAAKRALARSWRLLAPLPFLKEDYASDFNPEDRKDFDELLEHAQAVAELDGSRDGQGHNERAYLQAGIVTLDQSDFIIAVWDGEEARGVGGTAMIKEEAQAAGKIVLWVNANADVPPVILSTEDKSIELSQGNLNAVIHATIAPPPGAEIEHEFAGKKTHALTAYHDYMAEQCHAINYGSFFQFWERIFAGKWPFSVALTGSTPEREITRMRKETLAEKVHAASYDREVFDNMIIPRFVWADHLAIHYGNLYRSSYFFNYLFAALAVFLALFDLVAGGFGFGSKTVWISVEVSLIIMILGVTTAGKRGRWHEKWIDYRQLAEELRQYRLSYLTLGRGIIGGDLTHGAGSETAGWVDWYFAACRREAGMTSNRFDHKELRDIATTILEEEIRPQIAYHGRKAKTLHSMEHRLHVMGEVAFAATLLICLAYLSLVFLKSGMEAPISEYAYKAEKLSKNWVTMLTGFLPALGAAFFGIRVQGEFGSTAERSHATAVQLLTIAEKFETLANAPKPKLETLRIRVEDAAQAMLMENMDWRLLYISKPLNLPG